MKYEVIGWTYCGDEKYPMHEYITASVDKAIIKEIRDKKYFFGGDVHEEFCPVLNDGTYVSYSWRGWGRIMALAHDVEGAYSYMCAYMDTLIDPEERKYPEENLPDDLRIVPKESLTETFVMHLDGDMFEKMKAGTKTVEIRLFDDKRKEVDVGDYIEFVKADDENRRIVRRVANLYPMNSFKDLFKYRVCKDGEKPSAFKAMFTPAQAGMPDISDASSFVKKMRLYYGEEQEKEHGAVAFWLEEPKHLCRTKLRIYTDGDDYQELYDKKMEQAATVPDEEFERFLNECGDADLLGAALDDIAKGFKRFWVCFEYGENCKYDADVNVMLRKTLKNLFGKEEKLKAVCDRYCAVLQLEIFSLTVKDCAEPVQNLSLDKDISEFLEKSGAKLKIGQKDI